jgi:glycosyltransferase involved in cell wall biosynthesis
VVLNNKDSLEETIKSVISQKYSGIEYIIVDGGSTDGSVELIKEYYPDSIDKFVSEKDRGIHDAMNKGVDIATGDLVYFLNSDDTFYNQGVIGKVVESVRENPQFDYYYGGVISKNILGSQSENLFLKKIPDQSLMSGQHIPHQSIFVRRELFNQLGKFNIKYRVNAAYDWECKLVKNQKRGYFLDMVIAYYNQTGFSSKGTWSQYKEKISIVKKHFGFFAGFIYSIKSVLKFSSVYILKKTGLAKYISKFLNKIRGTNIR